MAGRLTGILQEAKRAGVQELQEFRSSEVAGVQECRSAGVQECRSAGALARNCFRF
jgi:hypothetical protein